VVRVINMYAMLSVNLEYYRNKKCVSSRTLDLIKETQGDDYLY